MSAGTRPRAFLAACWPATLAGVIVLAHAAHRRAAGSDWSPPPTVATVANAATGVAMGLALFGLARVFIDYRARNRGWVNALNLFAVIGTLAYVVGDAAVRH